MTTRSRGELQPLKPGCSTYGSHPAWYRYDDNGNRVYQDVEDAPVNLGWDFENRMVQVEGETGGTQSYTYCPAPKGEVTIIRDFVTVRLEWAQS